MSEAGYEVYAIEFIDSGNQIIPTGVKIIQPEVLKLRVIKSNPVSFMLKMQNKISAFINILIFHYLNCFYNLRKVIPHCDIYIMHSPFPFLYVYFSTRNSRAIFIYDAHEYYMGQNFEKRTGLLNKIYEFFLTKLEFYSIKYSKINLTVSDDMAGLLRKKYKGNFRVVMNVHAPKLDLKDNVKNVRDFFDKNDFLVLMLGNSRKGLDVNLLIRAIIDLDRKIKLILVGKYHDSFIGREFQSYKNEKYFIFDDIHSREIVPFIRNCDLGVLILDKRIINYYLCLPNKIFQYIHADVPYVFSDLKTVKKLSDIYKTGFQLDEFTEDNFKETVKDLSENKMKLKPYKDACRYAKKMLDWDAEEKKLLHIIRKLYD
ncbi:hypothetical protein JW890_02950 [candidate division WOR-3 bacterium]|nr:hypothetical protein [candidate division WOR-3 bacterium]